jgi:hypothetical protein
MTLFDDFWIHIGPPDGSQDADAEVASGGSFRVSVIHSPAGNATGKLSLPFGVVETGDVLARLDQTVRELLESPTVRDLSRRGVTRSSSKDLGLTLYRALFTGDVKSRFDESYGRSAEGQRVLRIRLHIELDDPDCQRIASLPWEYLWHPEKRQSLALSKQTTITRYLPVAQPAEPRSFKPPLRILFVSANPHGDLQLTVERESIEKRLAEERGAYECHTLENATYAQLAEMLGEDYHVVHFMGHGGFNGEEGVIALQDGDVPGSKLGNLIANQLKTNLVFLNACRTAEMPRRNGRDPFAGVASALVAAGVPAVIAMQFPITDEAAIQFAARFYSQVAQGRSIEEALLAGRQRIEALSPGSDEWATPVLMLRGESAVFQPSAEAIDGDPAERHRAAAELSDDSLLPFMADRTDLIFELSEAIREQDAKPSAPLVGIIHGDDSQCQDMLERRLHRVELPKRLNLRTAIKIFRMDWPREFKSADHFRRQLTWSFAESALPNADLPALLEYIGQFPAPVMVCSQILASEWKRLGDGALDAYLDWWDAWGAHGKAARVFAFLFIKYEAGSGMLGNWRSNRTNEAIAARLARLKAAEAQGAGNHILRVLPQLEGIGRQDVEAWNATHNRPLAEEEIRQLFVTWKVETKQETMPMVEIAKRLRELLERNPRLVEVLT